MLQLFMYIPPQFFRYFTSKTHFKRLITLSCQFSMRRCYQEVKLPQSYLHKYLLAKEQWPLFIFESDQRPNEPLVRGPLDISINLKKVQLTKVLINFLGKYRLIRKVEKTRMFKI